MLFWIITAVLTFAVAVLLLYPLWRASAPAIDVDRAGEEAVYRDQLRELERDKAQGLISAEQAEYARAEIGRRLLAVAGKGAEAPVRTGRHRMAQIFILLCLPLIGLGFYLETGSPGLKDQPLAARLENPGNNIDLLVAKVERHLAQNPEDGAGWDVLAPIYFRGGRMGDADMAYRNAIRLSGPSAARYAGLGEVIIAENDGVVTADASAAFEAALKEKPDNPRAEFYLALGFEQAGKQDEALAAFEALAAKSPADAPWLPLVKQHIAVVSGKGPVAAQGDAPGNPSEADIAAAQDMSAQDRTAMIRGMVDSLDAKLKENPDNFEGWMRLVRSYAMLKEPDRAVDALNAAFKTFPANGKQGAQLADLGRQLGLPVEDVKQ